MRVAIAIDDGLLREADEVAQLLGMGRSRLFALAVMEFLKLQRETQMLARLNEVYANGMDRSERRILKGFKAKFRHTVKDCW
jgi:metal-responsive CopG/Arc/MetJ family transcriptional regulator